MSELEAIAASLRAGTTPTGVVVLKRNRARVVARAGAALLKVFLERPANAAREARNLERARARGIDVPELLASGTGWSATRFLADARPATRADLAAILESVAQAHRCGLVHGDLHLGNLLVDGDQIVFLDLQRARLLPWVPPFVRRLELGYLAYSLGEPLPTELAGVRFWRDRRARTHWRSRTRRCVKESGAFTAFHFAGERGFRRRDADEAALHGALGRLECAHVLKDAPNGRLFRSGAWVLKQHASAGAARRAWLGGNGLEARGFATGRALAWTGRWLVMEDCGAPLDAWVESDFSRADAAAHDELAARLGSLLATLHRRGVYHADLKANNIVWSPGHAPQLLDYARVRFGARVSRRRRVKNLAQLNAALPDQVPAALREAALARYLAESGYGDDGARLRRDVTAQSLRRSHRWHGC